MTTDNLQADDRLLIRQDLRLIQNVALRTDTFVIGRSPSCDIRLDHPDVSATHARLHRAGDGWRITDNDSARGMRVNGRKTGEAMLVPGDVVDIRPFSMNFLGGETAGDSRTVDRSITLTGAGLRTTLVRDTRDPGVVIQQRLEDLYAMARLILARKENGSFWQIIHAALQRCLAADRCVLVGIDDDEGIYRLAPRARPSVDEGPLGVSRSVLRDTIEAGHGMLIEHVTQDARYAGAQSLVDSRSGSVICVPVVVGGKARAVVYADRQMSRVPFQTADLDFAMAAVDLAATAVSMDELQAQTRELSRIRGRIDVGREMQKMLLPDPIPQPAWGEVAALNYPADQMSGDIFDVQLDAQGRLMMSLADVSGKGVPAAFVTAILQGSFRQALAAHDDLVDVIRSVNSALDKSSPADCFATMVVCRWSADGSEVEIVNAGHHAPLWLSASGKVDAYPERVGIPLGILPDWPDGSVRRDARDDMALVLSSDGITEGANSDGDEFGLERMAEMLGSLADLNAGEIAQSLTECVRTFCLPAEPADDITLVVAKRT